MVSYRASSGRKMAPSLAKSSVVTGRVLPQRLGRRALIFS